MRSPHRLFIAAVALGISFGPCVSLAQDLITMPFPKISRAKAAQATAAEHQMEMVNMPSVAPLFLETPIFSTTITIVNAATPPADGLLVLSAGDRAEVCDNVHSD